MTLAAVVAGDNSFTVSESAFTSQVDVQIDPGNIHVVCIAADNEGSSGAASVSSVSDNRGNVYAVAAIKNHGSAASPHDSTTCAVFFTVVSTTLFPGDFITVNFSPATQAKAVVQWKVTSTNGSYVFPAPITATGNGTTAGWSGFSVTAGDIVIGVCSFETVDSSVGRDTDSVGSASWSAGIHQAEANVGGVESSSQTVSSQWKVPLATSTQQFANTISSAHDWCSIGFVAREAPLIFATPAASLGNLAASATATVTGPAQIEAVLAASLGTVTAAATATVAVSVEAVLAAPLALSAASAAAELGEAVPAAALGTLTAAATATAAVSVDATPVAAPLGTLTAAMTAAVDASSVTVQVTSMTAALGDLVATFVATSIGPVEAGSNTQLVFVAAVTADVLVPIFAVLSASLGTLTAATQPELVSPGAHSFGSIHELHGSTVEILTIR